MISPDDEVLCTKCDVLLCQELGDQSPVNFFTKILYFYAKIHEIKSQLMELKQVDRVQVESVKRALTFTEEMKKIREIDYDSDLSIATTLSQKSTPPTEKPKKRYLTSSSESENEFSNDDTITNDDDAERLTTCESEASTVSYHESSAKEEEEEAKDLVCHEVLTQSPKVAYLKRKRQRSSNFGSTLGATSFVSVLKKKRVSSET